MNESLKYRRDHVPVIMIALLAVGLYFSGEAIRSYAGPFTGHHRLDVVLGMAASAVGMILVGWWAAALALALLSEGLRRGGHERAALVAGALSPQFMKRLAAAALGLQLVAGGSAPASALSIADGPGAPGPVVLAGNQVATPGADVPAIEPQWKPLPGPMESGPLLRGELRQSPAAPNRPVPAVIEVGPGDSLWTIVARHLGPFATDVEIAQAWPRWHHENRQVIGDNPDLLLPGQLLRAPR
ncbi:MULTISPECIES: LysM peptidoglycan-binding domain-containing protein [unclassified Arthrobacter]|uniref:LysM peptidoglycan-binding domain-containing protein n=1 Tax=unclassified Arthrobacter TaxID=235627 RepID=UPI001490E5B6|nr:MULTISPECIES: LysM domain-containing protein [unclassified Arthrobacter]MBE0008684.1 LysM domain-containing protein [Arthrobacter sp. AET 35A]NOJ62517.1 LysM peptidoglycan-binding domain-containing protein [Arthrobacter sp. 147(2020)]